MTAANPDTPREFYGPAPVAAPADPALDPPCTIRAEGGQDWRTRLFDRDAVRAVRSTLAGPRPWLVIAGQHDELALTDDEVAAWPVMPAVFATVPWTIDRAPAAPAGPAAQVHERGDLDVEAFRG